MALIRDGVKVVRKGVTPVAPDVTLSKATQGKLLVAFQYQFLKKHYEDEYDLRRTAGVEAVVAEVKEMPKRIRTEQGLITSYVKEEPDYDIDAIEDLITSGDVKLSDFLGCVSKLNPGAMQQVFRHHAGLVFRPKESTLVTVFRTDTIVKKQFAERLGKLSTDNLLDSKLKIAS